MTFSKGAELLVQSVGDVVTEDIGGHVLRKESAVLDGTKFYRFTLNPGMATEYGTFWSDDQVALLRLIMRRFLRL